MKLVPRSLVGRLLIISTVTTIAALLFAAVNIGHVLERFVTRGLDQQLDAQLAMLARAVRSEGTLDRNRVVDLPVFDPVGQGWGWRVEIGARRWTGGDEITALEPRGPFPRGPDRQGPAVGEGMTMSGELIHFRRSIIPTAAGAATIIAGGPRRLADAPLREAMVPLLGSLAILGLALMLAIVVQLRFGLRPLRQLQGALEDVRAGRARHIPAGQPNELAPLADEMNALIDQNEAQLAHARRHVANLAHGLKTPLAALSIAVEENGQDQGGRLSAMVADIDNRVRHHLGRARATTPGAGYRPHTLLAPAVADLVAVLSRIHAEHPITEATEIASAFAVTADPQDLDEMLGNLLDNAWRHARARIAASAVAAGAMIDIAIEDDGIGLSATAMQEALVPGRRLDERGDGHGFGLPIVQELAELNGGSLTLSRSASLGGLRATLSLPAAPSGDRGLTGPWTS